MSDIHEYDNGRIEFFPVSEFDSMENPPASRENLHSPKQSSAETVDYDTPSALSLSPGVIHVPTEIGDEMQLGLAEAAWKGRKDKCLEEAEETYKKVHDLKAYKEKVVDFSFPNANTLRRIKKIFEDAEKTKPIF